MYKSIIIPIDLSHESSWRKALPVAIDQARHAGAKLHITTVVPEAPPQLPYLPEDYSSKMIAHVTKELNAFVKEHIPQDFSVQHSVRQGPIYREILQLTEEIGADLIIMASHRPELKDYLLGPNAARVVRHADCSVFVVRD